MVVTEKKEEEKESSIFKYIGEINQRGYDETGMEHWDQFIRLDERSHILKHHLKFHYIIVEKLGQQRLMQQNYSYIAILA